LAGFLGDAMTYLDQWKGLSAWIRGLVQAGLLYGQFIAGRSDAYHGNEHLRIGAQAVLEELKAFRDGFRDRLPPAAILALSGFISKTEPLIADTSGTIQPRQNRTWVVLTGLAALETHLSFLLSDNQEVIRARSERAFSHLQRSIIVDTELRAKWMQAFKDGEIACEKLGSVHLLSHGIWAFKIDAVGARTDLVFQEPVSDLSEPQRYSDGLVLTEWKKANAPGEAERLFDWARSQADRYATGALATSELKNYRYIVVVSEAAVKVPGDIPKDNIVYRHINIAAEPRLPSRG